MASAKIEGTSTGETLVCDTLFSTGVVRGTYLRGQTPNSDETLTLYPLKSGPAGYEWIVQYPIWNPAYQYGPAQTVIYNGGVWVVQPGQTSTVGVAPVAGAVWGAGALANPNPSANPAGRIYAQQVIHQGDGSVLMNLLATDNTTQVAQLNITAGGVKSLSVDRINLGSGAGVATIAAAGTTIPVALPQITATSVVLLSQQGPPQAVALSAVLTPGTGFTITSTPAVVGALPVSWAVLEY